ncbi:MAG: hypothetical protein CMK59_15295 [Proteobacteria bacterium]|nr:hypothetical protein [Pseudomonadota bacterium]
MPESSQKNMSLTVLDKILGILSLVVLGGFLFTTIPRLGYPYDLEWMEGGMLLHGLRVMNGEPLYGPPGPDFIPFIYPPLYSWLLALGGSIFGLDYWIGRSLSLLGSLVATGALIWALRKERCSWGAAAAAGAFFLSTYDDSGSFMDLVRTDGILLALLTLALVTARQAKTMQSGLFLAAAFWAKHNAAIFGFPIVWWLWRYRGIKPALKFTLWSALPALFMTILMQVASDGYFLTYLLEVPTGHPFVSSRFFWIFGKELFLALPLVVGLGLSWVVFEILKQKKWSRSVASVVGMCALLMGGLFHDDLKIWLVQNHFSDLAKRIQNEMATVFASFPIWMGLILIFGSAWLMTKRASMRFWLLNGVVAILFSGIMRGHHGGYINVLMPALWMISLWGGLLLHAVIQRDHRLGWGVVVFVCAQFYLGRWSPQKYLPTQKDYEAGALLIEHLKEVPKPVFSPFSPWYSYKAGHPPNLHLIALWDIDHDGGALKEDVEAIEQTIKDQKWSAILLANDRFDYGRKKAYPKKELVTALKGGLRPKVGWPATPRLIYYPKSDEQNKQ